MRPVRQTITLAAANAANIRTASAIAGAGAVVLNGSTVTNNVATLDVQRRVLFTSSGNDSGITFTVTGTDGGGFTITESLAGANISSTFTTRDFRTITSVTSSGASAGTVSIGTNGVASTYPVILDPYVNGTIAMQVIVSGTVNFTVQSTVENLFEANSWSWVNHPDTAMSAATATAQGNYAYPPFAVRLLINSGAVSGSGSATFVVLQHGVRA